MQGYFYSYDNPLPKRLVFFDHGMGSGHRGYMHEIELLAKHGYLVFSYDHTGCMESGGETTGGFTQSLVDLDDAINAVEADPRFEGYDISVVGHSWGGFSTLNITALHPEISHAVAFSGFISLDAILKQYLAGPLALFRGKICASEREAYPKYSDANAVESLKKSNSKVLSIHSKDDKTVRPSLNFDVMRKELKDKPNIRFVEVDGKGHNPSYTENAVKLLSDYKSRLKKAGAAGKLKTEEQREKFVSQFDWKGMTEQDMNIWNMVFEHLDN